MFWMLPSADLSTFLIRTTNRFYIRNRSVPGTLERVLGARLRNKYNLWKPECTKIGTHCTALLRSNIYWKREEASRSLSPHSSSRIRMGLIEFLEKSAWWTGICIYSALLLYSHRFSSPFVRRTQTIYTYIFYFSLAGERHPNNTHKY